MDKMKNTYIIGGNCMDLSDPEAPTLDEGMIPVTLADDGTVTTVSKDDSDWYNYGNKEWANVVLVNENATAGVDGSQSRSYYKANLANNVEVNQNDILAYYVWIPRYKYQIWTTGNSSIGQEQTINVQFESKEAEMSLGTEGGDWRTHPAFWWDDNSDGNVDLGETVAGIWVGKFETSTSIDSICYTSPNTTNCNNVNQSPRILPNVKALIYQSVSNQFETSQKFSNDQNIYGLSNSSTNAHMMKNSEWGAVAYLSHSVYGINDEIRNNNNKNYITGCGALEENSAQASECQIAYNSVLTPQSTTKNITGIFDLSGGSFDNLMGVLADDNGNPRSGMNASRNSGFNGSLGNNTLYTLGIDFPSSKYYDLYKSVDLLTACNGGICYGHALSETFHWYNDQDTFLNLNSPWLVRGSFYYMGKSGVSGVFAIGRGDGVPGSSWRSVIVVGYGA